MLSDSKSISVISMSNSKSIFACCTLHVCSSHAMISSGIYYSTDARKNGIYLSFTYKK